MEYRNGEESAETVSRAEESKSEGDKGYFACGNDSEETDYGSHSQTKNGAVAPKPGDVRNGDLVSLLLAATPPYLYNIPLVPQTFFFSEMLKSFVQAKTERQNMKAQQSHHRRQRKRSWREVTPPNQMAYDARDKPLELTTPKHSDDKPKSEKSPAKKLPGDAPEKKLSELGNFSVEKLANSSITGGTDAGAANAGPGDVLPPAPPLWYPLLYPPHPPYGVDPLHFFIDLRVSAHFWDRTAKLNNENNLDAAPAGVHGEAPESPLLGKGQHCSAFRVPSPRKDSPLREKGPRERARNVHYVISSLKDIYKSLEREAQRKKKDKGEEEEEEEGEEDEEGAVQGAMEGEGKRCKDLRALIGLELVVDYVKQESDGEDDSKSDMTGPDQGPEFQTVRIEQ